MGGGWNRFVTCFSEYKPPQQLDEVTFELIQTDSKTSSTGRSTHLSNLDLSLQTRPLQPGLFIRVSEQEPKEKKKKAQNGLVFLASLRPELLLAKVQFRAEGEAGGTRKPRSSAGNGQTSLMWCRERGDRMQSSGLSGQSMF